MIYGNHNIPMVETPQITKIHCHPFNPPCPSSLKQPAKIKDPKALDIEGPKKNHAVRFVSSSWVYHRDNV
jgi:hypothetical protein